MFWNGPGLAGGPGNTPWNGFPPCTSVSLQTSFFMACCGETQGPPVMLQPGDELIASSIPNLAARPAV